MKRIDDKIQEIENYLEELSQIKIESFEEYENDFKTKAACERYFEKIIEAIVDLALLILKERKISLPEIDKDVFDLLSKSNVISGVLAQKLGDAKGMRNVLAHQYGSVNDELVYNAISKELENDVKEFLEGIENFLEKSNKKKK
jgi:uncharacterized protein YutE (UPF0331/DUF86 family)